MEKKLEFKCKEAVEKLKGKCYKMSFLGTRGAPDRIVLMPGARIFFVEMKNGNEGKLRVGQKAMIRILEGLGFKVWVISTEEELQLFLLELK